MRPFGTFPPDAARGLQFILIDIDEVLTRDGRLPAEPYAALGRLHGSGITIIPITIASSGWCDFIIHTWPVDGVIGENGGMYARSEPAEPRRRFCVPRMELARYTGRLHMEAARIIGELAEVATAWDQEYRHSRWALTSRSLAPDTDDLFERIVDGWQKVGVHCAIKHSSVLGWFGDFDKRAMTRLLISEVFATDFDAERETILYIGASLSEPQAFRFFPRSVDVAAATFVGNDDDASAAWHSSDSGDPGFVAVVDAILAAR